ncbi:hypothetical protein P3T39_000777 [Kitasatospora sp. GP82]|nr:hypothetical protein [Kitasatospora sp. GP82]MDH6576059.1 hypothetical protein [Kitasatospora sp. MAP5-34]
MERCTKCEPRSEIRPLRGLPDDEIKRPLWEWPASQAREVIRERRRRFGWDDDAEERDLG